MIDLPELIILDVGHGNCAILRDTKTVTVIDCPPALTLLETLERLGISTVDQVLISHADLDHIGGLVNLLEDVTVRNVYINPDADKKSRTWKDIRIALGLAEDRGTEIHVGLTTQLTKKINSGQIDVDGMGLDNLLKKQKDIEAQILIFPHHGGLPGDTDGQEFAQKLCALVKPHLILFSLDRNRFGNPREDIMRGVLSAAPDAHIVCTQLSRKCAAVLPDSNFNHLTTLPALGRAKGKCCGGTISIKINGKQTIYAPLLTLHRDFVSDKGTVPEPMCLQRLSKVNP